MSDICPACGTRVHDLDEHLESVSGADCLRAVEMGEVSGE